MRRSLPLFFGRPAFFATSLPRQHPPRHACTLVYPEQRSDCPYEMQLMAFNPCFGWHLGCARATGGRRPVRDAWPRMDASRELPRRSRRPHDRSDSRRGDDRDQSGQRLVPSEHGHAGQGREDAARRRHAAVHERLERCGRSTYTMLRAPGYLSSTEPTQPLTCSDARRAEPEIENDREDDGEGNAPRHDQGHDRCGGFS